MKEELVVIAKPEPSDWSGIHPAIKNIKKLTNNLFLLEVPTFKAMTDVLRALSVTTGITLCTISNNAEVQARISVPAGCSGKLEAVSCEPGCEVMFTYEFPSEPQTMLASVGVETPHLLHFIRFCKKSGIKVEQIYDFF